MDNNGFHNTKLPIIRLPVLIAGFLIFLVCVSSPVQATEAWKTQTVDTNATIDGESSIALNSNNNPQISYSAKLSGDRENSSLMFAAWNGSGWTTQTIDSAFNVGTSSLAIDSSDKPHIAYRLNTGASSSLKYASWNGSTWDIQVVESSSSGMWPSLVIDQNGSPHISYFDKVLKYASWTGSTWDIQIVDSTEGAGVHSSLALDSKGNPHISYYYDPPQEGYNIRGAVKYSYWTGSNWTIQTIASDVYAAYPSLALDSAGNPHVSFANSSLKYASWTNNTWVIQTVNPASNVYYTTSLALDTEDNPHITYASREKTVNLKYTYLDNLNWTTQNVGFLGRGSGSLALDSTNNPHISYTEEHYGNSIKGDLIYVTSAEKPNLSSSIPEFPPAMLFVFFATFLFVAAIVRRRRIESIS